MFVEFLYELRNRGVKVGAQEALALAAALARDLHETSLDGFYDVARALCVHREQDLDAFDHAFAVHFRGVPEDAIAITEELLAWLRDPVPARLLSDEEKELLEAIDLDEAKRRLKERLAEQRARHDRGGRWIGTGGHSPHGRGGTHPNGIAVGDEARQGGRQGALDLANARRFRALRGDVTLDTRQIELALKRLRVLAREGALEELDLDGTIDATAKNAGELEVKLQPRRRSNIKVLLLLDIGGSMDPYAELSSRLFSAAKRATHFKALRTLYFHNCVYGRVYETESLRQGLDVTHLVQECDRSWRLIVVGDASMHPAELHADSGRWTWDGAGEGMAGTSGAGWLAYLAEHFERAVWLNPEPEMAWTGTVQVIQRIFPMYRLTLDGLMEAMVWLAGNGRRRK